jgi:hypothetical protein
MGVPSLAWAANGITALLNRNPTTNSMLFMTVFCLQKRRSGMATAYARRPPLDIRRER